MDEIAGRASVAFPRRWWYPACMSNELKGKPVGITLMDEPVVVFRDGAGSAHALADRCPHRNMPLSLGRVADDGCLECCYHGWRFDGDGTCRAVPGLLGGDAAASPNRAVAAYPVEERDGVVWLWPEAGATPARPPFELPSFDGAGTGQVVFRYDLESTMHAALENALDVPHTAFLHRGIFRGGDPREITAVRRDLPEGIEVQYLGEPVGMGPIRGKQGSATTFDHWDRFFLPGIAQIEYRVEGWLRIVNTIVHLPLSPFRTRAWFVVRFWTRLPAAVVKPIVLARGKQILRQDAWALEHQTEQIRRFGGEQYSSTDLDVMGNGIWRLLRRAERDEVAAGNGSGVADGSTPETGTDEVTFTI
ncbi:MAG TPA: aromatic ring-hydroxylating dioxygenase subunit alpha [Acidimicrobiia bacterium]|nr:aromatic ring-hydroxylating dioxygenase subunit alpha [Acidimicrobiia bacterium]